MTRKASCWCTDSALLSSTRTQTKTCAPNLQAHACIGGKSVGEDMRKLEVGCRCLCKCLQVVQLWVECAAEQRDPGCA